MPTRDIDPETGELVLTHREEMPINAYITNAGNGKHAAIGAGCSPAHADQSGSMLARFGGIDSGAAGAG